MKITGVTPFQIDGSSRRLLVVVVDTDEGPYGLGEAGLSGQEDAVEGALAHLSDLLVGEDPLRTEHLWQVMWRRGFFPAQGAVAAAASAVDIALWDLKGKTLGQPLFNLLGGRVRDRVPCYRHVGSDRQGTTSAVVAEAQAAVSKGWRHLRVSVAGLDGLFEPRAAIADAAELVTELRKALGPDVELIVDAHTRLSPPDAVRLCELVEPAQPLFVEDPLRSEHLEGYRRLRGATSVPLAAGEQLSSKWAFRPLIEEHLIDYARVDLCLAGGITEAVKIAALCETHEVQIAVHNPLGPVSSAACAHLNTALTPFGVQEQPLDLGPSEVFELPQLTLRDGSFHIGACVGLGVEIDREAAAASRPSGRTSMPGLQRADGSYTNW